jgi:hypothetical protein
MNRVKPLGWDPTIRSYYTEFDLCGSHRPNEGQAWPSTISKLRGNPALFYCSLIYLWRSARHLTQLLLSVQDEKISTEGQFGGQWELNCSTKQTPSLRDPDFSEYWLFSCRNGSSSGSQIRNWWMWSDGSIYRVSLKEISVMYQNGKCDLDRGR